jgi:hypothetical protein
MNHVSRLFRALSTIVAVSGVSLSLAPARAQSVPAESLVKARANCLTAVANVVGLPRGSLRVIKDQPDPSGVRVAVKVPKATAPWACLTNRQGVVKDVSFSGSEGAL